MKLTLIAEGSTKWQRFIRRWGVSYLIGEEVLFDTFGDAKFFLGSLARMKIDTSKIRHIVISHDHWDHLAGLYPLLEKYKNVTVYICPGVGNKTRQKLSSSGATIIEVSVPREIKDGIFTTGPIRGLYESEDIEEQSIVLKTVKGLWVITGCAHPGITNIIDKVAKGFGQPVSWVIGGMHLKDSAPSEIRAVIDEIKRLGVERVSPIHCTGTIATGIMTERFGRNCLPFTVGSSVALEDT